MNDLAKIFASEDIWYLLLALLSAAIIYCVATPMVKVLSVK